MSKQTMIILGVVLLIILAGGGLYFMNQNQTTPTTPEVTTQTETTPNETSGPISTDSATEGTVKEFTVSSTGFKFTPTTLTVNEGDTVKINYKNGGGTHNWTLDEFDAATKVLNTGEEETIMFVADKAGTYEYYCSVANHRQMGMVGTLTVQ